MCVVKLACCMKAQISEFQVSRNMMLCRVDFGANPPIHLPPGIHAPADDACSATNLRLMPCQRTDRLFDAPPLNNPTSSRNAADWCAPVMTMIAECHAGDRASPDFRLRL